MSSLDPHARLHEIRRRRLRVLRAEFSTMTAFAEHLRQKLNFVSRLLQTHPKGRKNLGEQLAREIEELCGKPKGWLDVLEAGALDTDVSAEPQGWPFRTIPPAIWEGLSPAEQRMAEPAILTILMGIEALRKHRKDRR